MGVSTPFQNFLVHLTPKPWAISMPSHYLTYRDWQVWPVLLLPGFSEPFPTGPTQRALPSTQKHNMHFQWGSFCHRSHALSLPPQWTKLDCAQKSTVFRSKLTYSVKFRIKKKKYFGTTSGPSRKSVLCPTYTSRWTKGQSQSWYFTIKLMSTLNWQNCS